MTSFALLQHNTRLYATLFIHTCDKFLKKQWSGDGNPYEQAKMVRFREGEDREDGWMEIKLGEFYVDSEENGEVQVQLLDTSRNLNSGLIVEGIEFRPLNSSMASVRNG